MPLPKAKPKAPLFNYPKLEDALSRVARARELSAALKKKHSSLFATLAEHETQESEALAELKKLINAKGAEPPMALPEGKKTVNVATADGLTCRVTYSQAADSYDASKLPDDILLMPGVITGIDSSRIAQLPAKKLSRCKDALVSGAYLTPRVSIVKAGDED